MSESIELILEQLDELEEQERHIKEADFEIERLNNIINELENFIKEDIVSNLCEIENKRIGYGQTEVDKIWLRNLWGFKSHIISKCNEILDKENK